MPGIGNKVPSLNANFALSVISRAAEIVAGGTTTPGQGCDAFSALQQARDEFKAKETRQQEKTRTYGWGWLLKDLGQYVKSREPAYGDSFTPIVEWSKVTTPGAVAQTLREAAPQIARVVEERTRRVIKIDSMSENELMEYDLMRKAVIFLKQQGLSVSVMWDRENPNDPVDYRGIVDGVSWAFELTELRLDPKQGDYLKVGHPNKKRSIPKQLEALEQPLPQIPNGPDVLQKAIDNAVKHGSKESKLKERDGTRYCLVLYNRQFCDAPSWEEITLPDFSAFDAVLILHQDSFPPAEAWQVFRNGFGKPVRSQDLNDLDDIAAFKNSIRTHRIDAELVKSTLRKIEALGLTDDDIRAAIAETRAKRGRQ